MWLVYKKYTMLLSILLSFFAKELIGQVKDRERPEEWKSLIKGARFKDLFLSMPVGTVANKTNWGADAVMNRYIDNGIEDQINSYWGGNIKKDEYQKYHLFVCGWLENSTKGHMAWPNSIVYHATSNLSHGPYQIIDTIGKGHNPELFTAKDGTKVIYVIDGSYQSQDLNGPWVYKKLTFDQRDRPIIEGLSNLTFAKREDGSQLMICRGGGVWISETGLSKYQQVSNKSVYPDVEGEFEDPVIWRDHVQYHLIVNDWLGRIAFYLRSPDGVNWITDPGEAYTPGIAYHQNGEREDWFKFERMKVLQDNYGRAIQANFAVIDTIKWDDKPNDKYSSKNISIPLVKGVLIEYLNSGLPVDEQELVKILIRKEDGFNPKVDLDLESLRFGSNDEVNYGRGSKVIRTESTSNGVILTFMGGDHKLSMEEFAPKLLGKRSDGQVLFGYCKVPWIAYEKPILSARKPVFDEQEGKKHANLIIDNLGFAKSKKAEVFLYEIENGNQKLLGQTSIHDIIPYGSAVVSIVLANRPISNHLKIVIKQDLFPLEEWEF